MIHTKVFFETKSCAHKCRCLVSGAQWAFSGTSCVPSSSTLGARALSVLIQCIWFTQRREDYSFARIQ